MGPTDRHGLFWDDLERDLEDPEFAEAFEAATAELQANARRLQPTGPAE